MLKEIFMGVEPVHILLAYAGMFLHVFVKIAEEHKKTEFSLKSYLKKNIFTFISSIIMIPLILIMATDTSLKEILPINKVTAVFAGWQTQSIFKSLMSIYSNRKSSKTQEQPE